MLGKSKRQSSHQSISPTMPTQSTLNPTFAKTNCVGNFLEIDETNKLWRLPSSYPQIIFPYTDILEYEVIKNGTSITKGGLGRAIVGGALFGGAGAIVGGVTGKKKTKTKVTEHKIKITLKNAQLPVVYINLLPFGSDYTADQITAHLAQMVKEIEAADSKVNQSAPVSAADEITKLKRLMDDGTITEQEFEAKKTQLLNIQEQQHNPANPTLQQSNTIPTKICKHCHANMPLNAIRCSQCGKKQRSSAAPVLIAFLIVILLLFLIVGIGVNSSGNKNSPTISSKTLSLAAEMELTEQQETDMLSIFDQCGILEIKTVTRFQEGEDRTSYHIDDIETQSYRGANNTIVVWIDNETKSVQEIFFNDNDIYRDGQVIAKVSDYYISDKLRQEYRVTAQMLINQYINYPDTAKYKSAGEWKFGVQDGFDVVQSTVEAENALKQKITENFQIKYDRKTGNPVSIIIGDQEYLS